MTASITSATTAAPGPAPLFDAAAALEHLQILGIDQATVRLRCFHWLKAEKDPETHHYLRDPKTKKLLKSGPGAKKIGGGDSGLISRIEALQQAGFRVYFVVNQGGDTADSITACRALYVEWDDIPIEEQINAWKALGLPEPTLMLATGGKSIHCYWKLSTAIAPELWRNLTERLIAHCNSDPKIKDPSRVMALAGSTYWEKQSGNRLPPKADEGTIKGQAHMLSGADGSRTYTAELFDQLLPPLPEKPPAGPMIAGTDGVKPSAPTDGFAPRSIEEILQALDRIPRAIASNGEYEFWRDITAGLEVAVLQAGGTTQKALDLITSHSPDFAEADRQIGRWKHKLTEHSFWSKAKAAGHKFWLWNKDQQRYADPATLRHLPDPPPRTPAPATASTNAGGTAGPETTVCDTPGCFEEQESSVTPGPDNYSFESDGRPITLQVSDLMIAGSPGFACIGGSLFEYQPDLGYWQRIPDSEAEKRALALLRLFYEVKKEYGQEKDVFCFGKLREIRDTVSSIKTQVGGGPLRRDQPAPVIVFANGTYNLNTGELEGHSPHHGATCGLLADFTPGATCPSELQRVIDHCFPEGAEVILRTLIRWVVDPTIRWGEAFHLLGDTGTGKGLIIGLLRAMLPHTVQHSLAHPAELKGPEQLHQYVLGRRLLTFPDCPARLRSRDDSCALFFELVENQPQSTRKLFQGEGEAPRPMFCRTVIGSVAPLQFRDGQGGFARRVLTVKTLPRVGDPDASLRDGLTADGNPRLPQVLAEAISWALELPLEEISDVLNKRDPEGLLAEAAEEAEAASDTVSLFVDACIEPNLAGPHAVVSRETLNQMFEAYMGYCRYAGIQYAMQRDNFFGQLRKVLGQDRCPSRRKESLNEAKQAGRDKDTRVNLPRLEAGFQLRLGLLGYRHSGIPNRDNFDRTKVGEGGLKDIRNLPPVDHANAWNPEAKTASNGASKPAPGGAEIGGHWVETPRPETPPPVVNPLPIGNGLGLRHPSGLRGGSTRDSARVSTQAEVATAPSTTGISANDTGVSQPSLHTSEQGVKTSVYKGEGWQGGPRVETPLEGPGGAAAATPPDPRPEALRLHAEHPDWTPLTIALSLQDLGFGSIPAATIQGWIAEA